MSKNAKSTKEIVVRTNEGDFTTLTIQGTNESILRKLLIELGDPEQLIRPGMLLEMKSTERANTVSTADRFLNYCLGWGVVDDPPADLDFGELLFVMSDEDKNNLHNPYMRKAYWLRYIINDYDGLDLSDQSSLVAEITALTLGVMPVDPKNPTKNVRKKPRSKRSTKK